MRRPILLCACATALLLSMDPPFTGPLPFGPSASLAQEEWKAEYESVCSKTDVAMTLSEEVLNGLTVRCDKLKPQIETEDDSTRKVYLHRLKMCRGLYKYILERK